MSPPHDWASGPAKWAAVLVLGSASIGGIAWSAVTRAPRGVPAQPARATREPAPAASESVEAGATRDPDAGSAPSPQPTSAAHRIDINTATASELELLPGIGPAMAARILEHRRTNGRFQSVEDLDNVKGIGPRTLEKLRPLIRVD